MWWMFPYGVAHAQTFDASGSALPPQRPSLSAPFAGFGGAPADAASASLTLEAASSTLVRQLVDGDTVVSEPVVGSLFGAQLAARANVHRRLELGLSAPVWLAAQGVADGAAAGDMHLWAPVRIVDRGPAAVAVVPFVRVPTGADARYLGDPFGGGGLVSVGLDGERLFAHADVGLDVGGPTDAPDWAGGARGRGALDVGIGGRQAALHAELRSRAPLQSVPSVPVEGLVGLRLRPADAVGLSVSGGRAITRGVGAGSLRMLVGLSVQLAGPDDRVATDAVADRPNSRDVNVVDDRRLPVRGAQIQVGDTVLTTDHEGFASVPLRAVRAGSLTVSAPGYLPSSRAIHADDP